MGLLNIVSAGLLILGLLLFAIGYPVSNHLNGGPGKGYRRYVYIGTWMCVLVAAVCQVVAFIMADMKRLVTAVFVGISIWWILTIGAAATSGLFGEFPSGTCPSKPSLASRTCHGTRLAAIALAIITAGIAVGFAEPHIGDGGAGGDVPYRSQ